MPSAKPTVPAAGQKITISGGKLQVPDRPGNGLQWNQGAVAHYRMK